MGVRLNLFLLISIAVLGCSSRTPTTEAGVSVTETVNEAQHKAALVFINDYVSYCNQPHSDIGIVEWVDAREDVTDEFKTQLRTIITQAEQDDAELGLGFDPILDAQDNPNQFVVDTTEGDYVVVRGKHWPEFDLMLRLQKEGDRWLVHGSGIINVPQTKRRKR